MKFLLFWISFLVGFSLFGQNTASIDNGMVDVKLITKDFSNNGIVPLVIIETKINDSLIHYARSDFDGKIYLKFCPETVQNKTLDIITFMSGYYSDTFSVFITADTIVSLYLKNDPNETFTIEKQEEIWYTHFGGVCGLVEIKPWAAYYYKHCDGRIAPYNKIDPKEMKWGQWKLLTSENLAIPISKNDSDFIFGDSICFINPFGDTLIPFGRYYSSINTQPFTDYCFVTVLRNSNLINVAIDKEGNELFDMYIFDNGPDYLEENRFRIIKNGKIGFANSKGEIIIEPKFACAFPFENGRAKVTLNCTLIPDGEYNTMVSDAWFYIDIYGAIIAPPLLH